MSVSKIALRVTESVVEESHELHCSEDSEVMLYLKTDLSWHDGGPNTGGDVV